MRKRISNYTFSLFAVRVNLTTFNSNLPSLQHSTLECSQKGNFAKEGPKPLYQVHLKEKTLTGHDSESCQQDTMKQPKI